jgi:hypothetical protein
MLKNIIDFATTLIGAQGARLLRDIRLVEGDPVLVHRAEEAHRPPRGIRRVFWNEDPLFSG